MIVLVHYYIFESGHFIKYIRVYKKLATIIARLEVNNPFIGLLSNLTVYIRTYIQQVIQKTTTLLFVFSVTVTIVDPSLWRIVELQ